MKKILPIFSFWVLAAVIIFLPFQALLSNIIEFRFNFSGPHLFWFIHWYEPVLIILFLVLLATSCRIRHLSAENLVAASLLVLGIILLLLNRTHGLGREIEGFRFTLFGVLTFLTARSCDFSDKQKHKLISVFLIVASVVALWGLIEKILPPKYWSVWGLIDPATVFGFGWHAAGSQLQIASVMGGPNQLASYLLPAVFLFLLAVADLARDRSLVKRNLAVLGAFATALAIGLTYSRSAILGLLIVAMTAVFILAKKKSIRVGLVVLTSALAVCFFLLYLRGNEIITHGQSQAGHVSAYSQSWQEIKNRATNNPTQLLFGAGLGTAGPIVLKYGDGIISESWYLQLVLELGLLGLGLWLTMIGLIGLRLFRTKQLGLALGLIAVSIAAIFLHTWSDNPALTVSLFLLIGVI